MAHIERKAYYVGTWREDKVTDSTMGQIIARSLAEKGQKVKIKLSEEGLVISKTVLFQENLLSAQALQDVYFLTVNQRHPCCLLCIVADPVRKYLILALRTVNSVEAQEIISTFKALKDNPTINSGNVVLRRKDNGNWTLRERSQHNANRHLQEIFRDPSHTAPPTLTQPNGSARGGGGGGDYTPVIDGSKRSHYRLVVPEVVGGGGGGDPVVVVAPQKEVDQLSQELQDVKFVVEKTGSVSSATLRSNTSHNINDNNNNDDDMDKSYYIETEILPEPEHVRNGEVIHVYSNGDGSPEDKAGEVRAVVDDHREDGVVRAHSNGSALPNHRTYIQQGGFQRPITVPEAKPAPRTTTTTTTLTVPGPHRASNGYSDIPDYRIHRRVSTEFVQVPDFSRKVSQTGSLRSTATSARVSFDPELVRRGSQDPRQFRSLRTSRSGIPSTVVRPIEEVYGHPRAPVLKRQGVYVTPVYAVEGAPPAGSVMYVPGTVGSLPHSSRRRSRPNSIHVMEGNELKVFHKTGEADDILL